MNYGFILFHFHLTFTSIRKYFKHANVNAIQKNLETFADS